MRSFTGEFSAAASCTVVALLASLLLVQPARAAGSETGLAASPPMMNHHPTPGQSPMPGTASMMPEQGADGRELVHFPPQMRARMLGNMRDHVQTLDRILQALGATDFAAAAKIAAEHRGLDSPAAAACKPKPENAAAPAPGSMDAMMAIYMPEQMRVIGLAMHTSASEFAVVAAHAAATHDTKAAVEALSRVTQNCVACHASYRLQ